MRDWRKLHKGIRSSDKLFEVSCEAKWLYVLLVSAQDDAGRYPWTPSNIRQLVSGTTEWDVDATCRYMSELVATGLISEVEGFAEVARGAELNGNPNNTRKPLYYESSSGTPVATRRDTSAHVGSREEKKREDTEKENLSLAGEPKEKAVAAPVSPAPPDLNDKPEWFRILCSITPGKLSDGRNRSGVSPDDTELIAWAEGKKISHAALLEVATHLKAEWDGYHRSRKHKSVRDSFQNLVARELKRGPSNVRHFERPSTGRITPPTDDELRIAHNR